jgi:hypothetical protein
MCGRKEKITKIWLENLKGRDHLENVEVDGSDGIKIDLIEMGRDCLDWIHLPQERNQFWVDSCVHCNEHLSSIKDDEFLEYLSYC